MKFHPCCMSYGTCDCDPRDVEIARLTAERDEAEAEVERLRNIMRSVLEVDQSVGTRSTVHDIAWSELQRKEGNE